VIDTAVLYQGAWVCRSSFPRFVDNGDGTVTDNKTHLMWEKKTPAGTGDVHDVNNTYSWSLPLPIGDAPDGTLYAAFLAQLSDIKCFAGHCDWRIPKAGELRSILSAEYPNCNSAPCIDPIFGPTQSDLYWSSSDYRSVGTANSAGNAVYAWVVYFGLGTLGWETKHFEHYARAVRSDP
jgi:hypothetical protein